MHVKHLAGLLFAGMLVLSPLLFYTPNQSFAITADQSSVARAMLLATMESDVDWLISEQNRDADDHFGYGSYWKEWYNGDRNWDGKFLDEPRIQEASYLLAWLWKNDPLYQGNSTVFDSAVAGLDHYARIQFRGDDPVADRAGRMGGLFPGFAWPQLKAYQLLGTADLGYITEWNRDFDGSSADFSTSRDVYLTPEDRWEQSTKAGSTVEVALPGTVNYFALKTIAAESNRTNNVVDRDADLVSDFPMLLNITYFDDFVGSGEFYVHSPTQLKFIGEVSGTSTNEWKSKTMAVQKEDLIESGDQYVFSIRFASSPIPIRSVEGLIDRDAYYTRTWEMLGNYIMYGGDSSGGAMNQDVAEAYTAYLLSEILDSSALADHYDAKITYLQDNQKSGVFMEGTGYDTGYQLVSANILAMTYRETNDSRIATMLDKALQISYDSYVPSEKGFLASISSRIPKSIAQVINSTYTGVSLDIGSFMYPFIIGGEISQKYHGIINDLIPAMQQYNLAGSSVYGQNSQGVNDLPFTYEALAGYSSSIQYPATEKISKYNQVGITVVRTSGDVIIMDENRGFVFYSSDSETTELAYFVY